MQEVRVLLVQLGSAGDCLLVTTIAKQIKEVDYPDCHLTWLIGSRYSHVIFNNPYIDRIIEIPIMKVEDLFTERDLINEHLIRLDDKNNFDKVFVTDFTNFNYGNWFGTTRSALFRSYPHKLKINSQPLIYLTDIERKNVIEFCEKNGITQQSFNILFECSPLSGQSLMTLQNAKEIAEQIVAQNSKMKVILSSKFPFISNNSNIIDGSNVSWRENAELANYCHLLVGCSSGISWLCTSNWTKSLPIIQAINPMYTGGRYNASMKIDFKYFGLDTKKLIELYNPSDTILVECIIAAGSNKFNLVKKKYDVNDNNVYRNYKFLKESRISIIEKIGLFIRYQLIPNIHGFYRAIKPRWFTPLAWIKRIL